MHDIQLRTVIDSNGDQYVPLVDLSLALLDLAEQLQDRPAEEWRRALTVLAEGLACTPATLRES